MSTTRKSMITAVAAGLLMFGGSLFAQEPQPQPQDRTDRSDRTKDADNTRMNKRDRNKDEATADRAGNSTSDRDLMQKIRQSIKDDKSLSTKAHNVKIVSRNGKVTLKGTVDSDQEKQTIEQKATEVAGAGNVTNELMVKTGKADRAKKSSSEQ